MSKVVRTGKGRAVRSKRFSKLSTDDAHSLVRALKFGDKADDSKHVDVRVQSVDLKLRTDNEKVVREEPKRLFGLF